jgi:2-oxoglutarate dehydrogenase E2 component (dihydrolipoamide succinyltransferase)
MDEIVMPQLGETVSEGTITKWFKAVGDKVTKDEALFEVSTDKVDSEVPSPVSGILKEIRVAEGEAVEVGAVLAIVAAEEALEVRQSSMEPSVVPDAVDSNQTPELQPEGGSHPGSNLGSDEKPTSLEIVPAAGMSTITSPVLRKMIKGHNLDVHALQGTGKGGRITRADVEQAISNQLAIVLLDTEPAPTFTDRAQLSEQRTAGISSDNEPSPQHPGAVVPFNRIRRLTGDHMVRSKATSPHVMTAVEVDYESVEAVRRKYREVWREQEGFSLTYLPFICRSLVHALTKFPFLNASVGDGELMIHTNVNLSIAVDLNHEGLLAPTVHRAEEKRLRAIAREISQLASRARSKRLSADELAGGTFTISNSGPFGTFMVVPVINQPQVAILSTDAVSRKPVVVTDVRGNESIAIHSVGMLALSWDHRAFDGAYAAQFMRELKNHLESHDWESEL